MARYGVPIVVTGLYLVAASWIVGNEGRSYREALRRARPATDPASVSAPPIDPQPVASPREEPPVLPEVVARKEPPVPAKPEGTSTTPPPVATPSIPSPGPAAPTPTALDAENR